MICIVKNSVIAGGPCGMGDTAVRSVLYRAGFVEVCGVLVAPDGTEFGPLPTVDPGQALTLGDGYEIFPVMVEPDAPGEGQMVTCYETVVGDGVAALRPVYGQAPPPPSLGEVKAAKQAEIGAGADAILLPLAAEYPASERETWQTQEAEALALQTDPQAPAPLVRGMALARGIDPVYLAGRILYHAAHWKAVSGPIIGQRQALQDQLDAAQDVAAVRAITVEYVPPTM